MGLNRLIAGATLAGVLVATAGCTDSSAERPSHGPEGGPSATATGSPSAEQQQFQELYGFALGDSLDGLTYEEVLARAERAKKYGSTVLRFDAAWIEADPDNDGNFDWTGADQKIEAARATGQVALVTLAYAPVEARDPECRNPGPDVSNDEAFTCAPERPEGFKSYVEAFANHVKDKKYEDTVKFIEIWNEQNNNKIDPERFAGILSVADDVVHTVLKTAKMGFGGMAPNAETEGGTMTAPDYLSAVNKSLREKYGKQPRDTYDAVGFHPYSYPALPSQPYIWNGMTQTEGHPAVPNAPNLYMTLQAEGIGDIDIWLDEFGAPTCGSVTVSDPEDPRWREGGGVDVPFQNKILSEFLTWRFNKLKVTVRTIHTMQDRPPAPNSTNPEDCFGVLDVNGNSKTAGFTVAVR